MGVDDWRDELDLAHLAGNGLVPDASFRVVRQEDGRDRSAGFLVEAELAPVSRSHWARRLQRYAEYYYSGSYEQTFGLRSLRLLIIVRGSGRQLRSILEEAERLRLTLTRATTWEQVAATGPESILFAPIWHQPAAETVHALYPRASASLTEPTNG